MTSFIFWTPTILQPKYRDYIPDAFSEIGNWDKRETGVGRYAANSIGHDQGNSSSADLQLQLEDPDHIRFKGICNGIPDDIANQIQYVDIAGKTL